jgi:molybdenum cofactor synthesis domain-containing protein
VGDELLRGDLDDTNAGDASRMLALRGVPVRARHTVGDDAATLADVIRSSIGRDDVVVVIGGLGPTSDDVTREGVARALGRPLLFHQDAWQAVVDRLTGFGVTVHEDNRRQALFPQDGQPLPNANGTAWGCRAEAQGTTVVMLPGPPRECLPMLQELLNEGFAHLSAPAAATTLFRRTLGLIEADAAALVDRVARDSGTSLKPAYRWHYPYVDIRLVCRPEAAGELAKRLDAVLGAHVVTDRDRTAVQALAAVLDERGSAVRIEDHLTEGALAAELAAERTTQGNGIALQIALRGTWAGGDRNHHTGTLRLVCTVTDEDGEHTSELVIPNRGPEVAHFAAQFAAWRTARHLTEDHRHRTEQTQETV